MENQNFIPDRIGSTQNPLSEKFNGAEGADKEKRTPDNSQDSSKTDRITKERRYQLQPRKSQNMVAEDQPATTQKGHGSKYTRKSHHQYQHLQQNQKVMH